MSKHQKWIVDVLLAILLPLMSTCLGNQNFTYLLSDTVIIPFSSVMDISNAITTSQSEDLSEGQIQLLQMFDQLNIGSNPLIAYNILYFNMQNVGGRQCYYNFFTNSTLSNISNKACSELQNIQIAQRPDSTMSCINYTGCTNQSFLYKMDLSEITYRQNIIMIENNHDNNTLKKADLFLSTKTNIIVRNSYGWFYSSVALTCTLLLSLVLLTGVMVYWLLNYGKAMRALEELRLTDADSQVSSLRKSLRKSLDKDE